MKIWRFQPVHAGLTLLIAGVAALYWQGLNGQLVLDDFPNLAPFEDLGSGAIEWTDVVFDNDSGVLGRPVAMLSFLTDFYIGSGTVWQFKFTNLVIHLLCGLLVFSIGTFLYRHAGEEHSRAAVASLFVTALWMTAPLFASTVLYVVQRMAQLAAFFSLVGILAYIYGRTLLDREKWVGFVFIGVSYSVAWPAAILSKENGVLLPALLLLVERFWFGFKGNEETVRLIKKLHTLFAALPILISFFWVLANADSIAASYHSRSFSLQERILTESRVLWDYVRQLFLPDGLRMGITHDDFVVSRSLFSPPTTILSLVSWVVVLAGVVYFRDSPSLSPLAFGLAFFLLGHTIESTIFPLELYFEHRNYLPAIGLLIGAVGTGVRLARRVHLDRRLLSLLFALPAIAAFVTYQRVISWQSPEALARIAEYAHPNSSRLQTALHAIQVREGNIDGAIAVIRRLEQIDGGRTVAHALMELGTYCWLNHRPTSAEAARIAKTTSATSDRVFLHEQVKSVADILLAGRCRKANDVDFNRFYYRLAEIADADQDWMMLLHTARIMMATGAKDEAVHLLDNANRIDPSRLEPWLIKAQILIAQHRFAEALECLAALEGPGRRPVKYQIELIRELRAQIEQAK